MSRLYRACSCILVSAFLPYSPAFAIQVRGKILTEDGATIAGATVFMVQDRQTRTTLSGPDGSYSFEDALARFTELVALADGYALDGRSMLALADMEADLVLTTPDAIRLRIVNNNFLPIPGARILTMTVNNRFIVPVEDLPHAAFSGLRSNDAGALTIPFLPPNGHIRMTVTHHHYANSDVSYLPVAPDQRDIILYKGAGIRGRITAEGEPVADARVSLFQLGVSGQRKFAESMSDREGYYTMRAAPDDYLVTARHPKYASPLAQFVEMRDPEKSAVADIELLPPYVIHGKIVLPDDKPCIAARVLFRIEDAILEDTFSDQKGLFTLRIGSNEGVLRVQPPPGYMTEMLSEIPLNLGDTRELTLQPIRLLELPVIRGKARFPEGETPTRLYLRSLDLPNPIHGVTGEDGHFEIPFFYQPDQPIISFRLEHPRRPLRRDFTINLARPGEVELLLEGFEPDLEQRAPEAGRPDLDALLLDKPAPPIHCDTWFNSPPLTRESLTGRVVALTFWAGFDTSHAAANRLRELHMLHELLGDAEDLLFLAVHDGSSTADEVEQYVDRFEIAYPVARDTDDFDTFSEYGITVIPQTMLIDRKGQVRHTRTEGRLLELIRTLRDED